MSDLLPFDAAPPIRFTRPASLAADAPRLNRQALRILARLHEGPVTNGELRQYACNYFQRIKEIRDAGIPVENYDRDRKTGLSWYRLHPKESRNG